MEDSGKIDSEIGDGSSIDFKPKCRGRSLDSGKGKSLTSSTDQSDDDDVQNGQPHRGSLEESSHESDNDHSFPFKNEGPLRTGVENASISRAFRSNGSTKERVVSDYSPNISVSSTSMHRSMNTLDSQNPLDISQDEDPNSILENDPSLNPGSLDNLMPPFEHSENELRSPAISVQSNEESYSRDINVSNDQSSQPIVSSHTNTHANQNRIYENRGPVTTTGNFHHISAQISLPAPATSSSVPAASLSVPATSSSVPAASLSVPATSSSINDHPRFLSLPPQGLVPKKLMDNLAAELVRERWKVTIFQLENEQLHMKVAEFEKRHITDNEFNQEAVQQLLQLKDTSLLLQRNIIYWKQKCEEKENVLKIKGQEMEAQHEQCNKLISENQTLNVKILHEQDKVRKLEVTLADLTSVLREERARFERDEKSLKEANADLRKENNFLREDPKRSWLRDENYAKRLNVHVRNNAHSTDHSVETNLKKVYSESTADLSVETNVKEVYSESVADHSVETNIKKVYSDSAADYQKQGARPKQGSEKSNCREVIQIKATGKNQVSPKLSSVENNMASLEEKCSNCYRLSSEFKSQEDFQKHKDKCQP